MTDSPDETFRRALGLFQSGQRPQAEALLREAMAGRMPHAHSLHLLGIIAYQSGRLAEAAEWIGQAIGCQNDIAAFHSNLGNVFKDLGRLAPALAHYRQALALQPDSAALHFNLGVALRASGDLDQAITHYRQALALRPAYPEALNNLGNAHRDQGHDGEAESCYRAALQLQPDFADAHYNLGDLQRRQGRPRQAAASYRAALAQRPQFAEAHNNLGAMLKGQVAPEAEAACYLQALAGRPDFADAHNNLGTVRLDQGCLGEALAHYRRALELHPGAADAHTNLIFAQNFDPSLNTAHQQQERTRWFQRHARSLPRCRLPTLTAADAGRRLRVGYVSAHFRHQAATYAFAPLVLHHDRADFSVVCYSDTLHEDDVTARLKAAATVWRPTAGMGDAAVAALIQADGVDILVDCVGHMKGNRLAVFAHKPAPLQVTGWGEPTGTGLETMDALLADPVLVPPAERTLFAETVVDLPCFLDYWSPEPLPEPEPPPVLASGQLTLGSFNRGAKLTDATLALWAGVLAAVPDATLVLKDALWQFPEEQERLCRRFAARGVAAERLRFFGPGARAEHFVAYQRIDIALDPFPHSGGMTTLDALWMGVPVVTLPGATPSSRLAAAVLSALGLPGGIAASPEDYAARVKGLASAPSELLRLRRTLRPRMMGCPVGDPAAYTRAVEGVYRRLWQEQCLLPAQRAPHALHRGLPE